MIAVKKGKRYYYQARQNFTRRKSPLVYRADKATRGTRETIEAFMKRDPLLRKHGYTVEDFDFVDDLKYMDRVWFINNEERVLDGVTPVYAKLVDKEARVRNISERNSGYLTREEAVRVVKARLITALTRIEEVLKEFDRPTPQ